MKRVESYHCPSLNAISLYFSMHEKFNFTFIIFIIHLSSAKKVEVEANSCQLSLQIFIRRSLHSNQYHAQSSGSYQHSCASRISDRRCNFCCISVTSIVSLMRRLYFSCEEELRLPTGYMKLNAGKTHIILFVINWRISKTQCLPACFGWN